MGPAGAQFGVIAVMYVDIVNNIIKVKAEGGGRKQLKTLYTFLALCTVVIVILFVLGLFPWMDNWAHLFGFFFGIFLSLILVKDFSLENPVTGKGLKHWHLVLISSVILLATLLLLILSFYVFPITEASGISYFNCIPFTDTFCKNMDVSINRGSTYTSAL